MRVVIIGHSMVNYRQWSLGRTIAELGHDVLVLCPDRWSGEEGKHIIDSTFSMRPLPVMSTDHSGFVNFVNYWLFKAEKAIADFEPDVLYIMEEPFTEFASRLCQVTPDIPKAIYTWENRPERFHEDAFQAWWGDVDQAVQLMICGNEGALEIAKRRGASHEKVVIPQTGVDTQHFRPLPIPKSYDIGVFGRMVESKGIRFIQQATQGTAHRTLWQGRGNLRPKDAEAGQWVSHEDLPPIYNGCRLVCQVPYNFMGYAEQGNYVIAEAMACAVPVIHSNNGSLTDFYADSPCRVVKQANVEELREAIETLLALSPKKYDALALASRKWVENKISLEAVAKRLVKVFEAKFGVR